MIKDLPPKVRNLTLIILILSALLLIGLAIYGATGCTETPSEIMCPAPTQHNQALLENMFIS